jgi:hypothetical protein
MIFVSSSCILDQVRMFFQVKKRLIHTNPTGFKEVACLVFVCKLGHHTRFTTMNTRLGITYFSWWLQRNDRRFKYGHQLENFSTSVEQYVHIVLHCLNWMSQSKYKKQLIEDENHQAECDQWDWHTPYSEPSHRWSVKWHGEVIVVRYTSNWCMTWNKSPKLKLLRRT